MQPVRRTCVECNKPFEACNESQDTCVSCMLRPKSNKTWDPCPGADMDIHEIENMILKNDKPLEKEPVMEEVRKGPGRPKNPPPEDVSCETLPEAPATPLQALDKLADDNSFRLMAETLMRLAGVHKMHLDYPKFSVTIELTNKA